MPVSGKIGKFIDIQRLCILGVLVGFNGVILALEVISVLNVSKLCNRNSGEPSRDFVIGSDFSVCVSWRGRNVGVFALIPTPVFSG